MSSGGFSHVVAGAMTFRRSINESVMLDRSGAEALCVTELVTSKKTGTKFVLSLVGQTFTAWDLFELTDVAEAPCCALLCAWISWI